MGHFSSSLYWITNAVLVNCDEFAWLIPIAAILIPAASSIFTGLCTSLLFFRERRIELVLNFAIAWIISEYLRGYSIFSFPWNFIGYASNASLPIAQLVRIFGIQGVGLIIVISGAILYTKNTKEIFTVYFFLGLFYLFGIYRIIQSDKENYVTLNGKPLIVRIVQPNIDISKRYYSNYKDKLEILKHTINLSFNRPLSKLIAGDLGAKRIDRAQQQFAAEVELQKRANEDNSIKPDIILWPEAGFPFAIIDDVIKINAFEDIELDNTKIITGIDIVNQYNDSAYNSVIMLDSDGNIVSRYHKQILVPFGEYMPSIFKHLPITMNFFTPGIYKNNIVIDDSLNIAPYICYEIIFQPFIFNNVKHKTDFIINLTNDSWFGDSIGPHQHLAMARLRAIEQGISIVRVASTGISAVIDPYGRFIAKTKINEECVIDTKIPKRLV